MTTRWLFGLFLLSACGGGNSGAPDSGGDLPDADTRPRPGKRSDIAGVAANDGTVVVFGGDNGPVVNQQPSPVFIEDTWVYEPGGGWTEITAAVHPGARGRYGVGHDPNNDRMVLFGGRYRPPNMGGGNYTLLNDLWAFDFGARTWSELHDGSGTAPPARYFPAVAYDRVNDHVIVFGGGTNVSAFSLTPVGDLWSHDGNAWTQVPQNGTAPSLRLFVGYLYDPVRNRLVVHGGNVDFVSASLADLYAFDIASATWSLLHDGSQTAPSGRFSAMMQYDATNDRYLLFGGHADQGYENDVWAFDPNQGTWTQARDGDNFTGRPLGCLNNSAEIPADYVDQDLSAPQPRGGGVFAVTGANEVHLFGGETDCSDHTDDVWRLDVGASTWTEIYGARSGESCLRRNEACSCLCL